MPEDNQDVCKWTGTEDGYYSAECDAAFCFDDEGPIENGFVYCPFCGKPLEMGEAK